MKYLIPLIALLVGYFAFFHSFNKPDTQEEIVAKSLQVQEKTETYSIDTTIETTGVEKIDTEVALLNEIELAEFRAVASSSLTASSVAPYELVKTSEKFSSSDIVKLDTLVVSRYEYTGGAHGNTSFETYTYGREKGLQYDLENILTISPEFTELLFQETSAAIEVKDPQADLSNLAATLQDSVNLQDFYLSGDKLVFLFEPYVVGPYALGDIKVELSMQDILPFARGAIAKAYGYQEQDQKVGTSTSEGEPVINQ